MRQALSILVRNHPGVLSHVAGLFTRRAFNIESIAAGVTEREDITRITILAQGTEGELKQIQKQLRKLHDVIEVLDLRYNRSVTRELLLVTVWADEPKRGEVMQIASSFQASVVDMTEETITVEFTGNEHKVKTVMGMLGLYGIKQMARTGMVALPFESIEGVWEPMI